MPDILRAALFMSGAIASFTVMAVAGRIIGKDLDTFEIMTFRSLVGIAIVLAVGHYAGTLHQVRMTRFGLHLVRNISHFTGQNLWFYALTVIPLAQVFALEFTSPLWVIVLSPLVLGERLTRMRVLAAVMGFIGILIVARPEAGNLNMGVATGALAAVGFAGSTIFTKLLTRTETITCILFWLTVMQAVLGIVCAGYDGDVALPTWQTLPWLMLIALGGLLAHFCITSALAIAPATVVIPIDFARLPVIAMVAAWVFGEVVDAWVFVGAAIIFAGNYLNILSETRKKRIADGAA